jgi:hypothetical protein
MKTSEVERVYPSWLSADRAAARGLYEKSMLRKEHWISLSAYNLWLGSAVDFCSQLGYTCNYSSTKAGYQDSFSNRDFDTFPANTLVTKMMIAAFNETTRGSAEDQLSQVQRIGSPRCALDQHVSTRPWTAHTKVHLNLTNRTGSYNLLFIACTEKSPPKGGRCSMVRAVKLKT